MNREKRQGLMSQLMGNSLKAAAILGLAAGLLAAPSAQAVPITSDLTITGSVGYDTDFASLNLSGTGTQSGSFKTTQGGVDTSSTFNDASVTGSNPVNGTLTDVGDGFGFTGSASSTNEGTYGIGIDFGLNVLNTSLTDTYSITFNIAFDNMVTSGGTDADAYAHSNFGIFDRGNNLTLFFTDLLSDALNGNKNGGQPAAGSGGTMTETGPASFVVTLAAGESLSFDPLLHDLAWTLEGGSFEGGSSSSASLNLFLSIALVENITQPPQPPNPTPEPATLALLGIGLLGLGALRRRRSN